MTCRLIALAFDANDPLRLARFWADALRWDVDERPTMRSVSCRRMAPGSGSSSGRSRSQKAGQNRIHLDLTTTSIDDQKETVERLVELGARHIDIGQGPDDDHVVLADPEGNEFCIIEPDNTFLADCGRLGIDHVRRYAGGRVLLERSARMAVGLGSGRRDRDPRAGRHRSVHHLGWPPLAPKLGKNRLHLDIAPPADGDQRAEVDRLVALGATRQSTSAKATSSWVVMADPDDNEFCVLTPR